MYKTFNRMEAKMEKNFICLGEPRMAKMIHATVHENASQVAIQAVFRKPENLTQSAFYVDESNGQYGMNSERSSIFSSTFYSDGLPFECY